MHKIVIEITLLILKNHGKIIDVFCISVGILSIVLYTISCANTLTERNPLINYYFLLTYAVASQNISRMWFF